MRPRWLDLLRGTVVDRLILHSGDIDIYVISGEAESGPPAPRASLRPHRPWQRYLWSLALVAVTTLLSQPIHSLVSPVNLVMLYLAAVVIAAVYLGRRARRS